MLGHADPGGVLKKEERRGKTEERRMREEKREEGRKKRENCLQRSGCLAGLEGLKSRGAGQIQEINLSRGADLIGRLTCLGK